MTNEFAWPNGCSGAISLTFDDGLDVQLATALPLLDRGGLRGTFYVNPRGDDWRTDLERWRGAEKAGHEIGNHSVTHMCPGALAPSWRTDRPQLEDMTLAEVEEDILLAEKRLETLFPDRAHSYCYPCYAEFVGSGATRQSYVPVVAKHFAAARGTGEFGRNFPLTCDLHYLWSWRCEGMSGMEMIGRAEVAAARRSWDIFTFHGIERGGLAVRLEDFKQFVEHLERARERLWVAPLVEVAEYIAGRRRDISHVE